MPQHVSKIKPAPLPINYDAQGTFLPVEKAGNPVSKQAKGVLERLSVRKPSNPRQRGDVTMRFLRSQTLATHSDILRLADYAQGEQPTAEVRWGGESYICAARYTSRGGRREPLEIGLMIGSAEQGQRVTELSGYEELRQTLAVACGFIVAKQELKRDAAAASFDLRIVPDFQLQGKLNAEVVSAPNILVLSQKLSS